MRRNDLRGRLIVLIMAMVLAFTAIPLSSQAEEYGAVGGSFETLRFDFGNKGTEPGYIGIPANTPYSAAVGYGFQNVNVMQDVDSSGEGVNSDAVLFNSGDGHVFKVDIPNGVYRITVTTGDVKSASITAEGMSQLLFLTGNNVTDSFTIPITDGQLNIYPSSGVGGIYSLSALVIEKVAEGTQTKPTIWIYGDSTVCNYYNVSDEHAHGWGQQLHDYIDMDVYDIRNFAINGMNAVTQCKHDTYDVAETYGKPGDIMILSFGISDYRDSSISESMYVTAMTDMIRRAKELDMKVYVVKQQGMLSDCQIYPVITQRWYNDELDAVAASEDVEIIDLFHPWLEFCLEKTHVNVYKYYQIYEDGRKDEISLNKNGASILARMVSEQLFPYNPPIEDCNIYSGIDTSEFDSDQTVVYQTESFVGPISNPHKGFVMDVGWPYQFEASYERGTGIGGSLDNHAWDVISVCYSALFWDELNPEEGVYNWKRIDDMLDACEKYGMTYGIRVLPYSTGAGSDDNYGATHNFVPQWVYDKGATMDIATYKYDKPDVEIKIPHWSNEVYIQAYKDFITAMAKRYDGDPRVEFVEIRGFGNFGEWHTSQFVGNEMPSIEQQKDMIAHHAQVFKKTTCCLLSSAKGEVYDYALSIGVTKRNDGLIMTRNEEWDLVPAYRANLPVLGDYHHQYNYMKNIDPNNSAKYLPWTETRMRETIEIPHLSMLSIDMDSTFGYQIYQEQKELIDEMSHRLGYNFTVTSAKRSGNKLMIVVKNTGLAPAFFDIELCAEITDINGEKIENFGNPVRIESGSFKDDSEQVFIFEYAGNISADATICLAMYDINNPLVEGKAPTVKFDNKNNLANNRLLLVRESVSNLQEKVVEGCSLEIKDGSYYFNIYTNAGKYYSNSSDYMLKVELPDGTVSETKLGLAKNVTLSNAAAGNAALSYETCQVVTVNIAAKDMYQTIMVSLYDAKGQQIGNFERVSLYEYASALAKRDSTYKAFVNAMLRYGAYAQCYFGGIDITATINQSISSGDKGDDYTDEDYAAIRSKLTSRTITAQGYLGTSLLLYNQTILRHYFDRPVSGAVKSGNMYYIEQAFNPTQYGSCISGYEYSVNDYISAALGGSNIKLKNLVCALYEYEVEAVKLSL